MASTDKTSRRAAGAENRGSENAAQGGQQAPANADRVARIREKAYELAAKRGFQPGAEVDDWLEAERQIDAESRH